MITEMIANSRSRWINRPALLNITNPASHITTSTTARIRNMAILLSSIKVSRERETTYYERGSRASALLGIKKISEITPP